MPTAMKYLSQTLNDRAIELRRLERRSYTFRTLYGSLFINRRRQGRREDDLLNSYIDWYGPWPLAATVFIILLCFLDAFFTLILINHGAVEINILMDWLIKKDIQTFAATKMAITSLALIVLVMHFNFRIYRVVLVRYLMYAMVPAYMALIAYEIHLLSQF